MSHEITVLDGFNRFKKEPMNNANMFNRFGVGANAGTDTMQGFNRILQGYSKGTKQDLDDWQFLVNIEHPAVMNGFEHFVEQGSDPMNGKKRDARRAKKETRKAERAEDHSQKRERKDKRQARHDLAKDQKREKKAIKLAKKQEKVLTKESRREERAADKKARRELKKQRQSDRRDIREMKQETRRDRAGQFSDTLREIGSGITGRLFNDAAGGSGMFQDMTFSDIPQGMLPAKFEDFITDLQDMPVEDALEMRDSVADQAGAGASGSPGGDGGGSSNMLPIIGIGILAAVAMGGKKGKKR